MKKASAETPRVEVASRAELRGWLARRHGKAGSVWLVTGKKGTPGYVPYDAIVEEALCFGWIDSLPRALEETRTMHLLSPRKPGSAWSKVNKARVEALVAAGKMTPSGLAVVEQARSDGSWTKLDAVETLVVPGDLAEAFAAHAPAAARFDAFPRSSRRLVLEWIAQAKTPATGRKRIEDTARLAAQDIRAHHFRQPSCAAPNPAATTSVSPTKSLDAQTRTLGTLVSEIRLSLCSPRLF